MTSYLKIFLTFLFVFFIIISTSLAVDTNIPVFDPNISTLDSSMNETISSNNTENYTVSESENNISNFPDTSLMTEPLILEDLPESDLGLSNILSIILIAVGLVLILLGIAIIIKLK